MFELFAHHFCSCFVYTIFLCGDRPTCLKEKDTTCFAYIIYIAFYATTFPHFCATHCMFTNVGKVQHFFFYYDCDISSSDKWAWFTYRTCVFDNLNRAADEKSPAWPRMTVEMFSAIRQLPAVKEMIKFSLLRRWSPTDFLVCVWVGEGRGL